ncbi:MAG: TonB-dependent receptor, partial [Fulvivirga sp.]|nr:TonB-dependent receptor [Fulvivirga sp.]
YSESGTKIANYGNFRLRGIGQERINMTLNGIPLNDMIDHGVFFSNFTDIAHSFESMQVQRGVGITTNGNASYAGSINFESINLEDQKAGAELQLGAGSFGTYRLNGNVSSGMIKDQWSFYSSYSRLFSDGFRDNTFTDSRSFFFSGGYYGEKDIVKITAFDARSKNGLGYLAVAESDLQQDPTTNYLNENDTDDFGQRFVQLQHSHIFSDQFKTVSSLYYGGAGGDFLFTFDNGQSQINFPLTNDHYGVILNGFWSSTDQQWKLSGGVHAYQFDRVNEEAFAPDFANPYYHETSTKKEFSTFGKVAWQNERWLAYADLQLRTQNLTIRPDYEFIGIPAEGDIEKEWTFLNPKIGVRYQIDHHWDVYGSFGRTGREPTRIDILGGFSLGAANLQSAQSDDFDPEYVNDFEAGARINSNDVTLSANYFYMDFENEIAPIGEVLAFGVQKRENIPESYRTGIEIDWLYAPITNLELKGNVTYMKSEIEAFTTDEGTTFNDVTPILSPEWIGNFSVAYSPLNNLTFTLRQSYVGESYLTLSNDADFILPDYWVTDFRLNYSWKNISVAIEVNNLSDEIYFTNGAPVDPDFDGIAEPGYFVNAGRNYFLTTKFSF